MYQIFWPAFCSSYIYITQPYTTLRCTEDTDLDVGGVEDFLFEVIDFQLLHVVVLLYGGGQARRPRPHREVTHVVHHVVDQLKDRQKSLHTL